MSEKPACMTSQHYECLNDLTSDSAIKDKFATKKSLSEFWCQLKTNLKFCWIKRKSSLCSSQQLTYVNQNSLPLSTKKKIQILPQCRARYSVEAVLDSTRYNDIVQIKTVPSLSLQSMDAK